MVEFKEKTIEELRKMASRKKIEGRSKMNKAQLVKALNKISYSKKMKGGMSFIKNNIFNLDDKFSLSNGQQKTYMSQIEDVIKEYKENVEKKKQNQVIMITKPEPKVYAVNNFNGSNQAGRESYIDTIDEMYLNERQQNVPLQWELINIYYDEYNELYDIEIAISKNTDINRHILADLGLMVKKYSPIGMPTIGNRYIFQYNINKENIKIGGASKNEILIISEQFNKSIELRNNKARSNSESEYSKYKYTMDPQIPVKEYLTVE